jgi:hypothetical protein
MSDEGVAMINIALTTAAPTLSISSEEVCFILVKAREFVAKDIV